MVLYSLITYTSIKSYSYCDIYKIYNVAITPTARKKNISIPESSLSVSHQQLLYNITFLQQLTETRTLLQIFLFLRYFTIIVICEYDRRYNTACTYYNEYFKYMIKEISKFFYTPFT